MYIYIYLMTCYFSVHKVLLYWYTYLLSFIKKSTRQLTVTAETRDIKQKQNRQYIYKRNIKVRSRNHCCRGKAINITYSEYVSVVLVIQWAAKTRRIRFITIVSLALSYFSTLFHKRKDYWGKKCWTQNVCFDFISNISHSKKNRTRYGCKCAQVVM
jgi:hypothetical protein